MTNSGFEHGAGFVAGEVSGFFGLGPLSAEEGLEEGSGGELGEDLIGFAANELHFKLRRQLGVAIDQN